MIPQAKLDANRRNAQLSTGPRTEEGKAKSSANAFKHGLTSQTFTLLPDEDPALYQAYIDETLSAHRPRTALEAALVIRLAQLLWQLGRLPAALAQLIQHKMAEHPGSTPAQIIARAFCDGTKLNAFERLQRYEAALDRAFAKTLQHLRQLQSENKPNDAAPAPLQDEPIAPPLTLSPGHPVTLSSAPPTPVQYEPTAAPTTGVQNKATAPSAAPPSRAVQIKATKAPITLSSPPPVPNEPTKLTPTQRHLLHSAASQVRLPSAGSML